MAVIYSSQMNSVRAQSRVDDIWEFVIRGADTGKCSLSEKIYELFVETNETFQL